MPNCNRCSHMRGDDCHQYWCVKEDELPEDWEESNCPFYKDHMVDMYEPGHYWRETE